MQKPILIFAEDHSSSIRKTWKNANDSIQWNVKWKNLLNTLSGKYDIKEFSFGDSVQEGTSNNYNETATNISDVFDKIQDRFLNQNVAAVTLVSDGLYNEGTDPLDLPANWQTPVYTVAMGDTMFHKYASIAKIYYNKTVYVRNTFEIKADVVAQGFVNQLMQLSLSEINANGSESEISKKQFTIGGEDFETSFSFNLNADRSGIKHYRLKLSSQDTNSTNSVEDFFIEVKENKNKIIIEANAPHPDVAALKEAIESDADYKVQVQFVSDFPQKHDSASLYILHDLPSQNISSNMVLQSIVKTGKPVLFILGSATDLNSLGNYQSYLSISGFNAGTSDAQAFYNQSFSSFIIPDEVKTEMANWPPLNVPYGQYSTSGAASVLAYQKIGAVQTNKPLFIFGESTGTKTGIICGDGLWRWRLYDFVQHDDHQLFDNLVRSIAGYLIAQRQINPFSVSLENNNSRSGNILNENERVIFDAQLLNDAGQQVNDPDVNLILHDEKGNNFNYIFSKSNNSYVLNAGKLAPGEYSYSASVLFNKKDYRQQGRFSVSSVNPENQFQKADFDLLKNISQRTGGKMYKLNEINNLGKFFSTNSSFKPIIYSTKASKIILDMKPFLFLLVVLMCVEWFIRKLKGSV
jgi:hypothetical protein